MWIMLTVFLAVSSETARSVLQDTFASLSVIVANHLWLLLAGTVALAFLCLVHQFTKREKNAPPVVSSRLPLCGSFIPFSKSPLSYVFQCYKKHGNVFTLNMFHRKLTFVLGPGYHDVFFTSRDTQLSQQEVYKFMTPVFGKGVVYDAPVAQFREQLRFMSTGLKTNALKTYVPKIVQEVTQYFNGDKFGNEGQFELASTVAEMIIMTASRCLMGKEIRETLFDKVADLYRLLDEGITPLSFFFPNAPIPQHLARNKARVAMIQLFSKVIDRRRATPIPAGEDKPTDILQVFMDVRYRNGKGLSSEEIAGLMIALLFAGQHTSTITTSWTLMLLLTHPEYLARVLKEQREILGDPAEELNWENINKMDVLHRAVREAIRMYPALIFLMRQVLKPVEVAGHTIPAGHTLVMSPPLSMRLPGTFSNPDSFDPDRYAKPRCEQDARDFTWVGFGGGFHACMGEQFAYLQVKTILSTMLRLFDLEMVNPTLPEPDYKAMVVGPKGPNMIRFRRKVPRGATA